MLYVAEVSLLPIRHTHFDVDHSFSRKLERLNQSDATFGDMHDERRKCYNEFTVLSSLREGVNYSENCQQSKCFNTVRKLTLLLLTKSRSVTGTLTN